MNDFEEVKFAPGERLFNAGDAADKQPSTLGSKIRSLLVGASVVVIVLGTFKMAMQLLDGDSPPAPAAEVSSPPVSLAPPAVDQAAPSTAPYLRRSSWRTSRS